MRASMAPLREWPGCPMAPVTGSMTVVLCLATSCSKAARNTTSWSARVAAWYWGKASSASNTIFVWVQTSPSP
ncbi:hypothetical protein G6F62_015968 [Rhizopus arrhizus]|nr:hypothetical protein G6F62_015968 [Rhizopus arrhizus]